MGTYSARQLDFVWEMGIIGFESNFDQLPTNGKAYQSTYYCMLHTA